MKQKERSVGGASALHAAAAALIVIPFFLFYRYLSAKTGIWEPWESHLFEWGRTLNASEGASAFLPIARGDFVPMPWLESFLAMWGDSLGTTAAALRTPWTLLGVISIGTITFCYSRIFGLVRGVLIGAFFGLVPCVALSAANAAGIMPLASMYSCALATYSLTRTEKASGAAWIAFGLFTALTAWAGLMPGLSAILYTVVAFRIAEHDDSVQRSTLRTALGVMLGFASAFLLLASVGGSGSDDAFASAAIRGLALYLAVPLAGMAFFCPPPLAADSEHRIFKLTGSFIAVALIGLPIVKLAGSLPLIEWLHYVVHPEPIVSRSLANAPFADVIRVAGFALFPFTTLLFYGMDYLVRTADKGFTATDRGSSGVHDAKLLLLTSAGATFLIFAVAYRQPGIVLFAMPLSIVAPIVLSLSDSTYIRWMSDQHVLRRMHAVTIAMLVLVLTKDVRGTFDEEGGRPGPRVMIEFITGGTDLHIPDSYSFPKMRLFVLLFLFAIVVGWIAIPTVHSWWQKRREEDDGGRIVRAATMGTAGFLLAAVVLFSVLLTTLYVPRLDAHVSSRALAGRLAELTANGGVLALHQSDRPWTLDEFEAETFDDPASLRELFCDDEEERRIFAVIPTDELPRYYEDIQSQNSRRGRGCETEFHVLYGQSERFTMVSNQLNTEAGEAEEGLLAEAIVEEDEIPESATRFEPAWTFDNQVELIAAEISPNEIVSGEFEVVTYWRATRDVTRDMKMFIHCDGPGSRMLGDHELVRGKFPLTRWVEGDIIVDRHVVEANLLGDAKGTYDVKVGLYEDDYRATVRPSVPDNRVSIGTVRVNWPFGIGGSN